MLMLETGSDVTGKGRPPSIPICHSWAFSGKPAYAVSCWMSALKITFPPSSTAIGTSFPG